MSNANAIDPRYPWVKMPAKALSDAELATTVAENLAAKNEASKTEVKELPYELRGLASGTAAFARSIKMSV